MADVEPSAANNYQAASTITFSRARWNAVMLSIATRLAAREALEASFEALIADGTQAALDLISVNVAPQLESLTEQINALEEQLEDIIGGGTAPNALQLGGQNPSFYLALANATGTLPVAQVNGVDTLIAAAVADLVNAAPSTLDTFKELSDALGGDANFATSMAAALGNRLRFDAVQALTDPQKAQALANLGFPAIGQHIRGSFTSLPPLCVWGNGQNVLRATYPGLLAATTIAGSVALTNASASAQITVASAELGSHLQPGLPIEAAGIQAGTTITAATLASGLTWNITLSAVATTTAGANAARLFPNGNGDGATTFGVADVRDRTGVGRGNMGGSAASRLTSGVAGFNSSRLGAVGGSQQMQSHAHGRGIPIAGHVLVQNGSGVYVAQTDGTTYNSDTATAGSGASGNVQPSIIENVVIFAGA